MIPLRFPRDAPSVPGMAATPTGARAIHPGKPKILLTRYVELVGHTTQSLAEIARDQHDLDVGPRHVGRVLRGESRPSAGLLAALCAILRLHPWEITSGQPVIAADDDLEGDERTEASA
jgi:hypothetical protein